MKSIFGFYFLNFAVTLPLRHCNANIKETCVVVQKCACSKTCGVGTYPVKYACLDGGGWMCYEECCCKPCGGWYTHTTSLNGGMDGGGGGGSRIRYSIKDLVLIRDSLSEISP